jgi:hypothetical protein
LDPLLRSPRRYLQAFQPFRPHIEEPLDAPMPGPHGGSWRWTPICIWSKNQQEEFGINVRGFTPEQAAAIRGKPYTNADRLRLGLC